MTEPGLLFFCTVTLYSILHHLFCAGNRSLGCARSLQAENSAQLRCVGVKVLGCRSSVFVRPWGLHPVPSPPPFSPS